MTKKKKDKKMFVANPIRQLCWRHLASYCTLSDGRQYQHLIAVINILKTIVPESELKKYFKSEYKNINLILEKFEQLTNHVVAFRSIVNNSDYVKTNYYSEKFRNYFHALQNIPLIHQEVIEVFVFLYEKTSISQESIPSSYLTQASQEIIFRPKDEESDKSIYRKMLEDEDEN